ncbi:condensin complex subunit 2 isoform X2 [Cryptomeria japonica]|uniref:condensin complex subunit 2 isoform X2 n=1 Tax=Cryptomeria japonica TaxID=3369 RepID=UPI0027DA7284|nr:condensin complex subunit 2 isoform X2 [Cryptomeria japonica]
MGSGVHSRTPLKAKAGARTRDLRHNDDDMERAQARASATMRRKSLLSQPHTEQPSPSGALLAKDQILDLFQNCIKLASENKINQRNTWELDLIDHLSDIIKVEDEDTETNFQKASCSLEAGVKIYSLRVDSVHSEAYKVLGGINRTGAGDAGDGEGETEVSDQQEGDTKESAKSSDPSTTLESSFDALNMKKFDVAFTVDPLYHQTSAQFDEGGAKGLLLNTLSVYNDCRIVFDSLDIPGKNMKSSVTQNNDIHETVDMRFIKDSVDQMVLSMQAKMEISPILKEILILLEDPYWNSVEAVAFMENNDDTIHASLDMQEIFNGEDVMDDAFDVDPQDFECSDNVGVVEDNLNNMSPGSHGSFAQEKTDNEARFGYGEFILEDDKDSMSEHTLDYLFLGMGVLSKSNAWAGPEHWKFRRIKDVQQRSDAQSALSEKDNKLKKKKKEPFSIDFLNCSETENNNFFAPPKTQRSLLLPQNSASNRSTLPEDCHYQPEEFVKLFLMPCVMCIGKKGRKVNDDLLEPTNCFEPSVTWGNQDGFDSNWDDALVDSDLEDSNVNMVVQPRKVQKIEVDYDKTSKQVDVHVLKRTLWVAIQDVCRNTKMVKGQKSKTVTSFQALLSNFPADCPAAAPEDISVHLCFICLLHLANEHCLSIQDHSSLDDLSIQIPVESLK